MNVTPDLLREIGKKPIIVMLEAADALEKSQSELAEVRRQLAEEQRWSRNYCDDLSAVTAENAGLREEIKELEADLRSSEAEENAAWDEADNWQERAEAVGRAVWKLIGYLRHADKDPYHDGEGCPIYDALPAWMRREIGR